MVPGIGVTLTVTGPVPVKVNNIFCISDLYRSSAAMVFSANVDVELLITTLPKVPVTSTSVGPLVNT